MFYVNDLPNGKFLYREAIKLHCFVLFKMPVCRSHRLQRDTDRLKFVMLTEHNARKWTELDEGLVACMLALVSSHCEPVWPSGKALGW